MNLNVLLIFLVLSAVVFIGPACHRASYGADDRSKPHIGIVFDIGGKDDRSFNAAAWAGVKCAETGMLPDGKTSCGKPPMDIVLRDVEPGNPTSIEPAMRAFAERWPEVVKTIMDEKIMKLMRTLDESSYPYDMVQLPYTLDDNGNPGRFCTTLE